MHETGLIGAAVRTLLATRPDGAGHVLLELGPGMDAEAARSAWRSAARGTPLAGAEVLLLESAQCLRCTDCGSDYPGTRPSPCPLCGGDGRVAESSRGLAIVSWVASDPV